MAHWQRTLVVVFIAQLFTAVGFSTIFPFLPLYVEHLGSDTGLGVTALSGIVFSAQAFTMMLASPFWGALADRFGRKPMVIRAMFGGSVTIFLMGYARSAEELIALRALQGLLSGVVAASSALVASVVPRDRTGYAMGMLQLALWCGIAVGPLTGGLLSDTFGFQTAFTVTAVLLAASGVLVIAGVRERFEPVERSERTGMIADWRALLTAPRMAAIYTMRFVVTLGITSLGPILPLFMQSLLPGEERLATYTGLVIGISSAASTFSAVYLGTLGDRLGHARVAFFSAGAAAIAFSCLGLVTQAWQLLLLNAISGACAGGLAPSVSALLAKDSGERRVGSVYGFDNSIRAGARALAPLMGAAVALWLSYRGVFVMVGMLFLLSALLCRLMLLGPSETARRETG
jgi:DHA1 family multidrug resistance protein-like MFS transporter